MSGPWTLAFSGKRTRSYSEAVERLERRAGDVLGNERVALLKRWCALLRELSPQHLQTCSGESEGGWQELNISPYETESCEKGCLVAYAQDRLYHDDTMKEPVTFRQLFLQSRSLQNLLSAFLKNPPYAAEEVCLLGQLLSLCLEAGVSQPAPLVSELVNLGNIYSEHKGSAAVTGEELTDAIVDALGGMKIDGELESLDCKIGAIHSDLASEFDEQEPDGNADNMNGNAFDLKTLSNRLQRAKQVWEKGSSLSEAVKARNVVFRERVDRQCQYEDMLKVFKGQLFIVEDSRKTIDREMQESEQECVERQKLRDRRVHEMNCDIGVAASKVKQLELQKAELERKLAKVEEQLGTARAKHCELVEDRQVFEEGEMLNLDGLQHKFELLKGDWEKHDVEARAIEATQGLVEDLRDALATYLEDGSNRAIDLETASEVMLLQSGERYCHLLHYQLELLLEQMRFCASEIAAMEGKEDRISQIGMDSIVEDVDRSRTKMKAKYEEAHAYAEACFVEAAHVCQSLTSQSLIDSTLDPRGCSAVEGAEGTPTAQAQHGIIVKENYLLIPDFDCAIDDSQGPGSTPEAQDESNRIYLHNGLKCASRVPGAMWSEFVVNGPEGHNGIVEAVRQLFRDIADLHSQFLAFERHPCEPEGCRNRKDGSSHQCEQRDLCGDAESFENGAPTVRHGSPVPRVGLGERTNFRGDA